MTKQNKKILVMATLLILLSSTTCAALIPNTNAAEMTTQEKGLSILNDAVGLDLSKYTVTQKDYQNYIDQYWEIPQESICYDFDSKESKLSISAIFVNGKLELMQVLENDGQPSLTKQSTTTNAAKLAQDFLGNYQTYINDPLYGELKATLDELDPNKNLTKTSANTQLEVTIVDGYTTFKWTYVAHGAIAPPKFVALGYDKGFLAYFVDNWQIYSVGSTNIALSENDAKAIALEAAKSHSWSLPLSEDAFDFKNFNESNVIWVALVFDNSLRLDKARSEDALMLYPVWRMGIALDKWYGNLYGIEVDIWADTKEVRSVKEAWSTITPEEELALLNATTIKTSNSQKATATGANARFALWIAVSILAAGTIGTTLVWMHKKNLSAYNLPKLRALKIGATILCVLLFFTTILMPIATVNAITGGAVVWGSESTGATPPSPSWRKSPTEISRQTFIANNVVAPYFAQGGYDPSWNCQGSLGSSKAQILSAITSLQGMCDTVAVVDFDHGVGRSDYRLAPPGEFHYMFEDNTGTYVGAYPGTAVPDNGVYDMDVYQLVQAGKISFAFINTCLSADLTYQGLLPSQWPPYPERAVGMPFAWMHRLVGSQMSNNGYSNPDGGGQCYIGFPWGSASLEQSLPKDSGILYWGWVYRFFLEACTTSKTVNQALDTASQQTWGQPFGTSPLRQGFSAYWWPSWYPDTNSKMAVYGDGGIQLKIN